MILGGCDRLVTGELVPRRGRMDAHDMETLALLAHAGRLEPGDEVEPVMIDLEPVGPAASGVRACA